MMCNNVIPVIYYIKLKSHLSICLSICLSVCLYVRLSVCLSVYLYVCLSVCMSIYTFWHADKWAVSARIEMGFAQNEGHVFEDHNVYFYKTTVPTIHQQECLENKGVSRHYPVKQLASGSNATVDVFYFNLFHSMVPTLNIYFIDWIIPVVLPNY